MSVSPWKKKEAPSTVLRSAWHKKAACHSTYSYPIYTIHGVKQPRNNFEVDLRVANQSTSIVNHPTIDIGIDQTCKGYRIFPNIVRTVIVAAPPVF